MSGETNRSFLAKGINAQDTQAELHRKGESNRREVMGSTFVDRALSSASPFSLAIQDFATTHAWGAVWGREGLSPRDRSLLNIAMLTALDKQNELAGHVRGALNNGLGEKEIQEALIQATIYSGMPAGMTAFRTADAVLKSWREDHGLKPDEVIPAAPQGRQGT
ncbi:4-carboxymuconolactone decarboxylase [Ceraceosorus bombacis]|uniref:4-carboxymuconolactone decarboxylase n=1 Tax=Ceraceosorus bombacis TaxID=401625 RepID=A0A0N7LAV8_9BASI|nr:4-carboxymuconolactone decarboxylase [Ceraceosorus bombacis]